MEQDPDPFAAEQTYLTEADIKMAQQRKGSYDEMDQEMDAPQIDSSAVFSKLESTKPAAGLEDMFENMQIKVMGDQNEENKSENASGSEDDNNSLEDVEHF